MNATSSKLSIPIPYWALPVWLIGCMLAGWDRGIWLAAATSWVILGIWVLIGAVFAYKTHGTPPLGSVLKVTLPIFTLNGPTISTIVTGILFIMEGHVALVVATAMRVLCWRAYLLYLSRD